MIDLLRLYLLSDVKSLKKWALILFVLTSTINKEEETDL